MIQNAKTELMKQLAPLLSGAPYHRGAGLWLAVSGGVDSMVMLDAFQRTAHVHQTPLWVAHVHHHTGAHADGALNLVSRYCSHHNLPLHVAHFHWDGTGNFEYEAAAFRRAVLLERLEPGMFAVLGHHLQDQAETFLQTLLRGAGVASRLGMDPVHGALLRPLLQLDRRLILDHAAVLGVPHVLDPSNYDKGYLRNHIRHAVLPELEARHGRAAKRLGDFMDEHRALRHALEADAERHFQAHFEDGLLDRRVFAQTPVYLWDFILKHFWAGRIKPKGDEHRQVRQWLERGEVGVIHMKDLHLHCDLDGLILEPVYPTQPREFTVGQPTEWGPWRLRIHAPCAGRGKLYLPNRHPKAMRDFMRRRRVPHRMRALLPGIHLGENHYHLLDPWASPGGCPLKIHILNGPNPNLEPLGSSAAHPAVRADK